MFELCVTDMLLYLGLLKIKVTVAAVNAGGKYEAILCNSLGLSRFKRDEKRGANVFSLTVIE